MRGWMYSNSAMSSTVQVDSELLEKAVQKGGFATPEAAANQALKEYVERRKVPVPGGVVGDPNDIIQLFGTIDFDPAYDYKEDRRRDRKRIPQY